MSERYFARSASDKTDDWPFWYVADRLKANFNVTTELVPELRSYLPFVPRSMAEKIASKFNNWLKDRLDARP